MRWRGHGDPPAPGNHGSAVGEADFAGRRDQRQDAGSHHHSGSAARNRSPCTQHDRARRRLHRQGNTLAGSRRAAIGPCHRRCRLTRQGGETGRRVVWHLPSHRAIGRYRRRCKWQHHGGDADYDRGNRKESRYCTAPAWSASIRWNFLDLHLALVSLDDSFEQSENADGATRHLPWRPVRQSGWLGEPRDFASPPRGGFACSSVPADGAPVHRLPPPPPQCTWAYRTGTIGLSCKLDACMTLDR